MGSNLGDRFGYLCRAVQALACIGHSRVGSISPVYETAPVGGPEQGPYLNAVVSLQTAIQADELLERCLGIENELGRERSEHWGPRTIDIDILLFGDAVIDSETLTVPHPRLMERGFVLYPLADMAPDIVHPVRGNTICELRDKIGSTGITLLPDLDLGRCIDQKPPENGTT